MARLRKKRKKQSKGIIKTSVLKIVVLLVIVGLNWSGLLAIGKTFAFFSNAEDSNANLYQAGTLGFSLNSLGDFSPDLDLSQTTSNRTINVNKDGSLGFQYSARVKSESITGDLCSHLELKDDLSDSFQSLSSFVSDSTTFSNKSSWTFTSRCSSLDPSLQGKICDFKLVFDSWQENIANYGDGGFNDTEEIASTIKMGYWDPPVVLNEFLPNAGDYPEFIEIYNKTGSPIDLSGFYIKADNNIISINTLTTALYSGGLTTIPANGWLVVTAGGNLMGDGSGTITLYNPNDIEVDSYTYGSPDHNVNNTPGWTNNLVGYWPLDGDFDDKSGNGNNGTNYGATSVSGKINQALSFYGVDDYVSIADNDIFDFGSGEFSVEFWVKTTSALRQWIATRYENYGPGWGLGTQSGHALGYIRTVESGTGKREIEGIVNVSDGSWHHIVMVRTGDKIKLYTDGAFEIEGTLVGNVNDDEPIEVGRISFEGGSQYMNGLIDEVKIYNRALSDSEILEHYNDVSTPLGAVPVDKSYARIPDGTGDWVDPYPTPGAPNRLSDEEIEEPKPEPEETTEPEQEEPTEEESTEEESGEEESVQEPEQVENTTEEDSAAQPEENSGASDEEIDTQEEDGEEPGINENNAEDETNSEENTSQQGQETDGEENDAENGNNENNEDTSAENGESSGESAESGSDEAAEGDEVTGEDNNDASEGVVSEENNQENSGEEPASNGEATESGSEDSGTDNETPVEDSGSGQSGNENSNGETGTEDSGSNGTETNSTNNSSEGQQGEVSGDDSGLNSGTESGESSGDFGNDSGDSSGDTSGDTSGAESGNSGDSQVGETPATSGEPADVPSSNSSDGGAGGESSGGNGDSGGGSGGDSGGDTDSGSSQEGNTGGDSGDAGGDNSAK